MNHQQEEQHNLLLQIDNLKKIFNTMPYFAAILDSERKIVLANDVYLSKFGIESLDSVIGNKPGDVFNCINTIGKPNSCGLTENCQKCYIALTINKSQQSKSSEISECQLNTLKEDQLLSFDLEVIASPVDINDTNYTLLTLKEISTEKNRKDLEAVFYHDVINKVNNLNAVLFMIKDMKETTISGKLLDLAGRVCRELTDEILFQKELSQAENNTLQIRTDQLSANSLIQSIAEQFNQHDAARNMKITVSIFNEDISFISDKILLERVLSNMLKNALEGSSEHSEIFFGCESGNEIIIFKITNPSVIHSKDKDKIFRKYYSTKGVGRGLGTYSMKLLTEKYLKGKIYFESEINKGTTFFVELKKSGI